MEKNFENFYLAKSNPKETIQQHTDKLLLNLDILKNVYPNLFLNWDILYMLKIACLYHDIGKINVSFQKRIMGKKEKQLLPHGLFSLCFLDGDNLYDIVYKKYLEDGNSEEISDKKAINFVKIVANAIAYHHERDFPSDAKKILRENLENLKQEAKNFKYDKVKNLKVEEIASEFFSFGRRILPGNNFNKDWKEKNEIFKQYILIKGLLNRIDYASSSKENISVEIKNDFLENKMQGLLKEWKLKDQSIKWNILQEYMILNRENNVIVVAQTGMGKTEAGLLWIGNNKGFFVLPLKTAINAIYERIKNQIIKDKIDERIGLLHSETKDIYLKEYSEENILDYYERTKQLSLPLTICTLDQIFDFVYRYKGFEMKLATLSYSKVVLDEIQMYSPDLVAYIIKGLKYITNMGGRFAILTATFPRIIEDLLKKERIDFKISDNFIKKDLKLRHCVEIKESRIDSDFIISCFNKNKILVICNTIKEAQKIYEELQEKYFGNNINLFHSKFIKRDRKIKEKKILKLGDKDSKDFGIWVTTQIVEASLDIDFDLLITELSDLNGLLQRMGRCFRNRELKNGQTNCFVFIGDDKIKNSGVGFVIDKDIHNFSRELVKNKINGNIYEQDKMKYVEELYTTENLKNTAYYNKILETLEYLELIDVYEKKKEDVKREFRDITSYLVIPKNIYDENKEKIEEKLNILKDDKTTYNNIMATKLEIRELTLSIQGYEFKHIQKLQDNKYIELGKYEKIYIVECDYSFEKGFSIDNSIKESIIDERFL